MRKLDKTIPQDTKRNRDNDQYVEDGERNDEDSRSCKHNNYGDRRIYFISKHQ